MGLFNDAKNEMNDKVEEDDIFAASEDEDVSVDDIDPELLESILEESEEEK